MKEFTPDMPLREARRLFGQQRGSNPSSTCPCCLHTPKPWRVAIYNAKALSLLWLCRRSRELAANDGWVDIRKEGSERADTRTRLVIRNNTITKLKHWNLIEQQQNPDGTAVDSMYRPTKKGLAFAAGRVMVEDWLDILDDEPVGFSDKLVSIEVCFKRNFHDTLREFDSQWDGDFGDFLRRNFPGRTGW